MMRWRSDPTGTQAPDQQSLSTKSKNDSEPDTTTSSSAGDLSMAIHSLPLRARLEDGDVPHRSTSFIMASSAADHLAFGQQQIDHSDDSMDDNVSHDNFSSGNNKNKRSAPSSHVRSVAEAEPPDTDTETTATSAGAAASHLDDDDGGDHATEEDDARSQTHLPWKPQTIQSTCEFTHNILDYAQKRESGCKKAEYSAVTTDELGNRWRLIVYVNGNGRASNHHLSLFLQVADADDLPFGWKKSVSYVLTLEHPAGGSLSYAKRNPDKTFKLCPKAIDWGWSQFITSDRIQQEGFVHADSLTVRAQVSVKSSSVEIDEEDAELYLKCAVEEGDANSVRLCLEQGASVNCQFKDDLYTPLHTACSSGTAAGSMEVLQLLLDKGADGNACNKWHETPLLIAANNGHRLAVEALLQHGANPSLCSEAGWSALTFAAHKGYDDIVDLLLRAGAPVNCPVTEDLSTPLHKACAGSKSGHLAAVKLLLKGGAHVHALNKWRETPLLTAANHGQAGAVEALLAAGADPCKCTDTGWSPLSIAAYKGHDDVVRILLEEGAPTEEDDPTLSALLQAATKGLPDTVELLLRHGADHTVTTKKGDTALSILVEQNLIDAAVEMVTEYNASIPRCSRDRKKVQRARLLINLRMKQLEKEGKENPDSSDDEETDDDDVGKRVAQHVDDDDDNESFNSSIASKDGKKKKKSAAKQSAEDKARAAEEALLLELAQEDAHAKKAEAEASSKRAKKKKKREREREQKLKEERERQEQREQEEKEREERERIRKEKEEKERKERELKLQQEKERKVRELMEREKLFAAKRKEREERERREKEPRQFTRNRKPNDRGSISPVATRTNSDEKRGTRVPKGRKVVTDPTPNKKIVSPKSRNIKPVAPLASNRRWETAAPKTTKPLSPRRNPTSDNSHSETADMGPEMPDSSSPKSMLNSSPSSPEDVVAPSLAISPGSASNISVTPQADQSSPMEELILTRELGVVQNESQNGHGHQEQDTQPPPRQKPVEVEHPAIALFRRDRISELLHRCVAALNGLIDELSFRRIIYRWIVRAAHNQQPCIDPFVPSWINVDELAAFFQRQFIGENRRHYNSGGISLSAPPSIESLKEAGSSVAVFCQNVAKQVYEYSKRIGSQVPDDWSDASLGMSVAEGPVNGRGSTVTISWGNRAHVFLPSLTFATLRDRHVEGTGSRRFLTSAFVARIWYDSSRLITKDTPMDFRLSLTTQGCLSANASVSAELFSEPFTALDSNVFWGRYEHVDALFGGQKPFGKEEHGSEDVITRLGGSISVLLPLDNVVAAQYVQRIIKILDDATVINVPVSFIVFIHAESFYEISANGPSVNDLHSLDPRLGDLQSKRLYIRRAEQLPGSRHTYFDSDVVGSSQISLAPSLILLLQNEAGYIRFKITDASMARIVASMSVPIRESTFQTHGLSLQGDFPASKISQSVMYYPEGRTPVSPGQQRFIRPDHGESMPSFSPKVNGNDVIPRGRRGRLFALEDDGDEDQLGDVDLMMSGMLTNLDVAGLFQNTTVGADNIDIEAISLMGIGPPSHSLNPRNSGRFG